MKISLLARMVIVGTFSLAASFGASAAPSRQAAVCTWGGTELHPTGTFQVSPGVHTAPSGVPMQFSVQGDLAGPSPRCTGNMTLDGVLLPGSSCSLNIGYADVGGLRGVASDTNVGVTFYIRGTLFARDGTIAGSYDDSVLSNGVTESIDRCNSKAGFTGGPHWATVTLYPAGV